MGTASRSSTSRPPVLAPSKQGRSFPVPYSSDSQFPREMAPGDSIPAAALADSRPRLRRALGRFDLTLLCVVAVANLNVVPAVAAAGPMTLWLWFLALALFFWPQGVAVIELAHRYPQEGGIYLWSKEMFGDFHGFLSGWCYWMTNVCYVPTLLLYLLGTAVYLGGAQGASWADHRGFTLLVSLGLLWVLVALNIRGLGVGKWINNAGGIGTAVAAAGLIGLAAWGLHQHGSSLRGESFRVAGADWPLASTFGVVCFALVGLELGCLMGDEIRDPLRTVPAAVLWGGVISGILYVCSTLALLLALPRQEIAVVQGVIQAVSRMAEDSGIAWLVRPLALVLSIAAAGVTSAWLSGSARIPFVAGLDKYLPSALGRLHPQYTTPYVALLVHGSLASVVVTISFVGASVKEAYLTMLDLAVILQLIPFVYMYSALVRLAARSDDRAGFYRRRTLWTAGTSGLVATALGVILAFVPSRQIESVWGFEAKLVVACALFLGAATVFFRVNSSRKLRAGLASVGVPADPAGGTA